MNGTEDRLRGALEGAAETVRQSDLSPLVAPRVPTHRRQKLAFVAITAAAAVTIATLQLWPVSADKALASWTPIAGAVDDELEQEVVQQCAKDLARYATRFQNLAPNDPSPKEFIGSTLQPLLVDRRGANAFTLVSSENGYVGACGYVGLGTIRYGQPYKGLGADFTQEPARPLGGALLTVDSTVGTATDDEVVASTYGRVAPNVAKVLFLLDDGTEVQATVKNGWYLAWWPEIKARGVLYRWTSDLRELDAIRAYDASGELVKELRAPIEPRR